MAYVPWDDIPDSSVVPDGRYDLSIMELRPYNKEENDKLIVAGQFAVLTPAAFSGMRVRHWFVIGNDDDPEAEDVETWKATSGAKKLKRLFKVTKAKMLEDLEDACESAVGGEFTALITVEADDEGDYKGVPRNRLGSLYELGAVEAGVSPQAPSKRAPGPSALNRRSSRETAASHNEGKPQRASRLVDPPVADDPVDDEDDGPQEERHEEVPRQRPTRPARRTSRK